MNAVSKPSEIDVSTRLPLLVLFISAAVWLVLGSVFAFLGSLIFHQPNLFSNSFAFSYGHLVSVRTTSFLYGAGIQLGLAFTLWMFCRLGRTPLAQPILVTAGAALWNLGVTIGVIGIFAGDATGFETLQLPRYAALIVFLGYLIIATLAVITLHARQEQPLYVSHWFLLAALFWFAWIYSTANLSLLVFPVRGVTQAIIAWWFTANLQIVWFGLVGIGAIFYFVPKLTNRALNNHYLALFTFWMLILFASWMGVPNSAPVPAWMPALSTVGAVLTLIPVLTFALNLHGTIEGKYSLFKANPLLKFVGVGIVAFVIASLMNAVSSIIQISHVTDLTWFTPARTQLYTYGFFAMVMFAAAYYIVPQLIGLEFPSAKLINAHFLLATAGIVLIVLPLALGGIVEGAMLQNPANPFLKVAKTTLMFLRLSTLGDLLLLAAHLVFFVNVVGLVRRFYVARAAAAYAAATAEIGGAKA
ncbi:MAG TPA: cbb3-type cytochrome c oxidase subunit I [Patescibacteria group bacterium]|nr:cbb3-type cytochrome c oxidase subunit I [Patescibacteria group bacterium]